MSQSETLLRVENLKKYFKTPHGMLHAVDDLSFTIERGRTLGVVGESGCGKSTLGRTILQLTPATDGRVFLDGVELLSLQKKELRQMRFKMQMIFQDPSSSLNPRHTVSEIIAEPLIVNRLIARQDIEDRVNELMETVGLDARYYDSYPHELDGGRRQRIGIARSLAMRPEFVVCDEPVSALDVSIQAQILNLLMDLQDSNGLTYMFITHDLSVVRHISDDIAVLYVGQCVEKAPVRELFTNPQHPYTQSLLASIPIPSLEGRNKKREIIMGEISDPIDPLPGCRFAPRCPYQTEACLTDAVELKDIGNDHYVACVMVNGDKN